MENDLVRAIEGLTRVIDGLTFDTGIQTSLTGIESVLKDITIRQNKIMSAISDYAAAVGVKLDEIVGKIGNVSTEVGVIVGLLNSIQNSPGVLSPAEQKALDDSLVRIGSVDSSLDAVVTAAQTPIVPATGSDGSIPGVSSLKNNP